MPRLVRYADTVSNKRRFRFGLRDPTTPERFVSGLSFATGDWVFYKDGSAENILVGNIVELGSTGVYEWQATQSDVTCEHGTILVIDQTGTPLWQDAGDEFFTGGDPAAYYDRS